MMHVHCAAIIPPPPPPGMRMQVQVSLCPFMQPEQIGFIIIALQARPVVTFAPHAGGGGGWQFWQATRPVGSQKQGRTMPPPHGAVHVAFASVQTAPGAHIGIPPPRPAVPPVPGTPPEPADPPAPVVPTTPPAPVVPTLPPAPVVPTTPPAPVVPTAPPPPVVPTLPPLPVADAPPPPVAAPSSVPTGSVSSSPPSKKLEMGLLPQPTVMRSAVEKSAFKQALRVIEVGLLCTEFVLVVRRSH
jgi:hypothetical protein